VGSYNNNFMTFCPEFIIFLAFKTRPSTELDSDDPVFMPLFTSWTTPEIEQPVILESDLVVLGWTWYETFHSSTVTGMCFSLLCQ
jgi:hypothetical protein